MIDSEPVKISPDHFFPNAKDEFGRSVHKLRDASRDLQRAGVIAPMPSGRLARDFLNTDAVPVALYERLRPSMADPAAGVKTLWGLPYERRAPDIEPVPVLVAGLDERATDDIHGLDDKMAEWVRFVELLCGVGTQEPLGEAVIRLMHPATMEILPEQLDALERSGGRVEARVSIMAVGDEVTDATIEISAEIERPGVYVRAHRTLCYGSGDRDARARKLLAQRDDPSVSQAARDAARRDLIRLAHRSAQPREVASIPLDDILTIGQMIARSRR